MGLLDAHVLAPLSIPVVGSERRNATHTTPGLALLDWPWSVDRGAPTASRRLVPGRHGGMRWPTSIGTAHDPAPGKEATTAGVPSSPQHFRDERLAGKQSSPRKTRKHELEILRQHSLAQRSCGALIELLVCATASYETHYCPCEIPVDNEAAMPFLEAG